MSKYKLLALDLDGTLLDTHERIRPRVRTAVQNAVKSGCLVTLATGRRLRPARQFAAELGLKLPLILYSGGIIFDTSTEMALYHRPIPPTFLTQVLGLIPSNLGVGLLQSPIHGEYIWFGPPENDSSFQRIYATDPVRSDLVRRCSLGEMHKVADVLTITSIGPSENILPLTKTLRSRVECNIYTYNLSRSGSAELHGFDILPLTNTKAHALKWLAAHYDLEMHQTMVVGDGPNDVEMFEVAGLGVAMGNAVDEVKAKAGATVASNNEDGVAEAIEKFIL